MRFKDYLKEAIGDYSNLKSDIKGSFKFLIDRIRKFRQRIKKIEKDISKLTEQKNRSNNIIEKNNLSKQIEQLRIQAENIRKSMQPLLDQKKRAEEEQKKELMRHRIEREKTKGEIEKARLDKLKKSKQTETTSKSNNVEERIKYLEKLFDELEIKRQKAKGQEALNIAHRMASIENEIKNLRKKGK